MVEKKGFDRTEILIEEKKTFDETEYLKKINNSFEINYHKFGNILLDKLGKLKSGFIEQKYRDLIDSPDNEEIRVIINMALEYFLTNSKNITEYNEEDPSTFKKFEKFSPLLLITVNDLTGLISYLEFTKKGFDEVYEKNRSCLYLACKCGYKGIVKYLLKNGANLTIKQENNSTALHAACYYKHQEIVNMLLLFGSPYNAQNNNLKTPEQETTKVIRDIIQKYKNFKDIFNDNEIVGKRFCFNVDYKDWDLAWHGTQIDSIPSIIQHGLKKCGDTIDNLVVKKRTDDIRLKLQIKMVKQPQGIFTSSSVFYSSNEAYAENFKDKNGEDYVFLIECRLKPHSYEKSKHSLHEYTLESNEEELVENRSTNSNEVKVTAIWNLSKKFIQSFRSHSSLLDHLNKYI